MPASYLIKPILDESYPMVSHGKGVYLYDMHGKDYLDASSGAVTCSIGHGVKEVIEAMNEQSQKVSFVYRSQFTSKAGELLAKKIASLMPGDLNWSFFVNSGSEAVETAMKIALQYWQEKGNFKKTAILSRWNSYHGITLGGLSLSGFPERRNRFENWMVFTPSVSPPYCYRCPMHQSYPGCKLQCADELETAINRIGADNIAAFIAEPVIGAAGAAISPPDGYYQKIRQICDEYNILFIADEVMSGTGRTGKMLALEHWGVIPDIAALGKGLAAGYSPIAAAIVSDKVMGPIQNGTKSIMSGHTYSANPQAAAAALAVLSYMEQKKLMESVMEKGDYLKQNLMDWKERFSFIGDVRGKGLLLGVEVVKCRTKKAPFSKSDNITSKLVKRAAEKGLLIYPSNAGIGGKAGNGLIIAPPLTIKKSEMDELLARLKNVFIEFQKETEQGYSEGTL
ncbi:aspartate aminotransferase family protein [Metabacillus sp. RGM 3146]|uniref:aspartate aminotransferase family protein n=1 Tax=Metabacillus sp. RGM 3146 TaxID=3401092 RepID=UPI003B9C484A